MIWAPHSLFIRKMLPTTILMFSLVFMFHSELEHMIWKFVSTVMVACYTAAFIVIVFQEDLNIPYNVMSIIYAYVMLCAPLAYIARRSIQRSCNSLIRCLCVTLFVTYCLEHA